MRPGSEILVGLRGYRGFPGGFKAYRKAFPTVELSWWHRVGDVGTISRIRALAPEGFRFSAVGHKHLTFRPTGEERRVLRRLLRRFRLFGPKAGALRLLLPEDLSPEALEAWLPLLEAVQNELGPVPIAFQAPAPLKPLLLERGLAVVNAEEGPFLYLLDPERLPPGKGYAYFAPERVFPNPPPGPTLGEEVEGR